jgi:hypothetical protein
LGPLITPWAQNFILAEAKNERMKLPLLITLFLSLSWATLRSQALNPNYAYPALDTAITWGDISLNPWLGGHKLYQDAQGNHYIIGLYEQITDLDPGPGYQPTAATTGRGAYLQKLDANYNLVWARSWPDDSYFRFNDIKVDHDQSVYLTGYFSGTAADVDPISSHFITGSDSVWNAMVIKLDSSGFLDWARAVEGAILENVYVVGNEIVVGGEFHSLIDTALGFSSPSYYYTPPDGAGFTCIKFNKANGSKNKILALADSASLYMASFGIDQNGNYLFSGGYRGHIDFDPDSASSALGSSIYPGTRTSFLVKYDSNFTYLNHIELEGNISNRVLTLHQNAGTYWISGYYANYAPPSTTNNLTLDLDPGPSVQNINNYFPKPVGYYFLQFDTSLNLIRHFEHPVRGIGNTHFKPNMLFKGTDVYIAASYREEVALEPRKTNGLVIDPNFNNPIQEQISFYIIKMNQNDSIEWAYYPPLPNATQANIQMSSVNWDGDKIVALGTFRGPVNFDMNLSAAGNKLATGRSNFFLRIKACANPDSLPEISRVYTVCSALQIGDTTLVSSGWHTIEHILANKEGCDSVLAKDSVFVFNEIPTVTNNGTYLETNFSFPQYATWIDCSNQAVVKNGGSHFYPQSPGNYALVYGHPMAPGCGDTLPCEIISQISLLENKPDSWQLYPNPAQTTLTLQGPLKEVLRLRVLQVNGQEVCHLTPQVTLPIAALPPGLYWLEISTAAGVSRQKFVKEG